MAWISRLHALFGRDKLTREFDEELNFHLSMREQWNLEQGMPLRKPIATPATASAILPYGASA